VNLKLGSRNSEVLKKSRGKATRRKFKSTFLSPQLELVQLTSKYDLRFRTGIPLQPVKSREVRNGLSLIRQSTSAAEGDKKRNSGISKMKLSQKTLMPDLSNSYQDLLHLRRYSRPMVVPLKFIASILPLLFMTCLKIPPSNFFTLLRSKNL